MTVEENTETYEVFAAKYAEHERREGRLRVYQLNPEPLRAVDSWLEHYRSFWTNNLANLKAFVEAEYAKEIAAATAQTPSAPSGSARHSRAPIRKKSDPKKSE